VPTLGEPIMVGWSDWWDMPLLFAPVVLFAIVMVVAIWI
jgi:hypothetical protein